MTDVMKGVRILEVAEHTFVPAASAILADWGAEVIKIEHVERGDAMRGLASSGVMSMGGSVHVLLEHSNRGKKSIGVDLTTEKGVELTVHRLAATSDVFLTNKLPGVRKKLRMEVDDIRAHNPDIIYVAGTGGGEHPGPDADRGGYDFLSYWCRGSSAMGCTPPDAREPGHAARSRLWRLDRRHDHRRWDHGCPVPPRANGRGGLRGRLAARCRARAISPAVALSLQTGFPWRPPAAGSGGGGPSNPLVGTYKTEDGRFLAFTCLQGFHYWPAVCRAIGREELITDERFTSHELLSANAGVARDILTEVFEAAPLAEWQERLAGFEGQWSFAQDSLEVVDDPQVEANGYVGETSTAAGVPFRLVTTPVQFGGTPAPPKRAPDFNEHCEEILASIDCDTETMLELKIEGVVA